MRDFALWKGAKPGEPSWSTSIGEGRPGWHIECSAMSMRYLGASFDIHTGGIDLVFPHHEDEIAQSEAATGQPFVRTWLHCAHLQMGGEKMAKRTGNIARPADLYAAGISPRALRYALLAAHYRAPLDFSEASLAAAPAAVERLSTVRRRPATPTARSGPTTRRCRRCWRDPGGVRARRSTTTSTSRPRSARRLRPRARAQPAHRRAVAVDAPTPRARPPLLRELDRVLAVLEEDADGAAGGRAGAARCARRGARGARLGPLRRAARRAGGAGRRGRGHQGRPALAADGRPDGPA